MTLSAKHRRFAEEYLLDLNATQAAIRAGYATKSASGQGSQLLKRADVKALIEKLTAERTYTTKITHDRLLQELEPVAYSCIDDYRITGDIDNPIVPRDGVSPDVMRAVKSIKATVLTSTGILSLQKVEITLHDKMDGIKTGMRHLGMLSDKLTIDVNEELRKVIYDAADEYDRELSRIAARKRDK